MPLCPTSASELAKLHRANALGAREAAAHFEANADSALSTGDLATDAELRGIAIGLRLAATDYLEAIAVELEKLSTAN